jgi:hypothetical protein
MRDTILPSVRLKKKTTPSCENNAVANNSKFSRQSWVSNAQPEATRRSRPQISILRVQQSWQKFMNDSKWLELNHYETQQQRSPLRRNKPRARRVHWAKKEETVFLPTPICPSGVQIIRPFSSAPTTKVSSEPALLQTASLPTQLPSSSEKSGGENQEAPSHPSLSARVKRPSIRVLLDAATYQPELEAAGTGAAISGSVSMTVVPALLLDRAALTAPLPNPILAS